MRKTSSGTAESVLGSPVRNLVSILCFMATVVVLATPAYMRAGWSFADAIYMVTLTIYTVGDDEVRPIDSPYLHAVTLGLIVLGCTRDEHVGGVVRQYARQHPGAGDARLVLFPESAGMDDARFEQLAKDVADLGLQLELVVAADGSAVTGLTVADAERRGAGAFLIVQIDHAGGGSKRRPGPTEKIGAVDRVLLLARGSGGVADTLFTARAEVRVGRNVF